MRRAILAQLTQRWGRVLTEPERTAWRAYASGTSWTNKVGTAANISGLAAYVRLNTLLMMAGVAVQDTAPTLTGHAGTPTFTFTAEPTNAIIKITQPSEPFDKNITGSRMIFFQHIAANAGRLAVQGRKRYLGTIVGNAGTPPAFPNSLAVIFPLAVGQRIAISGIFIDPSYRIGGDYTLTAIAANP
jgi:hypothetical protein